MSKELVARALELLDKELVFIRAESFRSDPMGVTILGTRIDDSTADLIRAVDEQYPEGYDARRGFLNQGYGPTSYGICRDCYWDTYTGNGSHAPNCTRWNTRVALLALCRDITGEKG